MESLLVDNNGCVGVVLTLGEPTGLELPEFEFPGSGRLLPAMGEIDGGVTEDITIVGGLIFGSKVNVLLSHDTDFISIAVVGVFASKLFVFSALLCVSK